MSEARNVYPRLCWGCLGVIEDFAHDHSLMDYGGYCTDCEEHHRPYRPEIDDVLRGRPERMNDVSEREELLKEVKMSEEDSEPTTGELATGGVIEETFFLPGTTNMYIGDVPWASQPPPPPWQRVGDPVVITQGATTTGWVPLQAHGSDVPLTEERILELMNKRHPPIRLAPAPEPLTEERMRQIVTETMMRVLYPEQDGSSVSHQHRRVRQWDEDGVEWRGVLYKVERE